MGFRDIKPVCALDLFHGPIDRALSLFVDADKQSDGALCRCKFKIMEDKHTERSKKYPMAKYKVFFSGFAYVEAKNEESAQEQFNDDLDIFREQRIDSVIEIDEFTIMI